MSAGAFASLPWSEMAGAGDERSAVAEQMVGGGAVAGDELAEAGREDEDRLGEREVGRAGLLVRLFPERVNHRERWHYPPNQVWIALYPQADEAELED
jgi:hypothetical protein